MKLAPVPAAQRPADRPSIGPVVRARRLPSPGRLARRRLMIRGAKLALPALALTLLATLAVWPEWQGEVGRARAAAQSLAKVQGAIIKGARYRSIDERGRPYTLTASTARQAGENRLDLTDPKGDIILQNGTWLMLQARQGVYRRPDNALDLSHDVTLYRDDGTTMITASAALDLKNGAAAGAEPVHAEGPFGRLDAAGGFTATDKGEQIFFAGPSHLLLNGADGP
ncbi:MAG TPA: LPS export ABC transporter periplasmic protein LptC [Acetobacteraceae bacterium]|nr:LPS export ABC transporter periplasmic protein LptC [Acetobacteraceae bacterium]